MSADYEGALLQLTITGGTSPVRRCPSTDADHDWKHGDDDHHRGENEQNNVNDHDYADHDDHDWEQGGDDHPADEDDQSNVDDQNRDDHDHDGQDNDNSRYNDHLEADASLRM